ncbi:MAG: peptide chain release factor N(5)-glutamine methyltransferase [Cyanobacteria bacterium J06623_7]
MSDIPGQDLSRWYRATQQEAIANNIDPGEVDWLLQTIADLSSLDLRLGSFKHRAQIQSQRTLAELDKLWQQRLQERLPVQYLVETVFWRHFQLKVTPDVLIPRPETELAIDLALKHNRIFEPHQQWVDLGTGSGAIALGLADVFPHATIHAVDLSAAALNVARENAARLALANICFYQGSWWSPLTFLSGKVTGMVSNPPYIPTTQIAQLQPEVAHEPRMALDGGDDGLDDIRYLIESAPQYLVSGGLWLTELMIGQATQVAQLLKQQGQYDGIEICPDLNGIDRFVLAYKR